MDTNEVVSDDLPVIAFDHEGDFFFEPHHLGICDRQAEMTCEQEADMLIFSVTVEMAGRWF
jgi:hypothetical protein